MPTTPLALGRVHRGDCLDLLARVPDASVHLAFADPPFNIGYDYDAYDDGDGDNDGDGDSTMGSGATEYKDDDDGDG